MISSCSTPTQIAFVVADAAGKGLPAAIFITLTRTLLRAAAEKLVEPGDCLRIVNAMLCIDNPSLMFTTAFYGVLDTQTGEILYANAGHNPPYVIRANGDVQALPGTGAIVLGVMEDVVYSTQRAALTPGDTLVCYTDGVTEAIDGTGALYGDSRLISTLANYSGKHPTEVLTAIIGDVDGYMATTPMADDVTLLVIRYNGFEAATAAAASGWKPQSQRMLAADRAPAAAVKESIRFVEDRRQRYEFAVRDRLYMRHAIDNQRNIYFCDPQRDGDAGFSLRYFQERAQVHAMSRRDRLDLADMLHGLDADGDRIEARFCRGDSGLESSSPASMQRRIACFEVGQWPGVEHQNGPPIAEHRRTGDRWDRGEDRMQFLQEQILESQHAVDAEAEHARSGGDNHEMRRPPRALCRGRGNRERSPDDVPERPRRGG